MPRDASDRKLFDQYLVQILHDTRRQDKYKNEILEKKKRETDIEYRRTEYIIEKIREEIESQSRYKKY